jgi:aminoglycoside phosphotransferase (APT) family kinase protein
VSTFGNAGAVAARFALRGAIEEVAALPGGHINESYRVTVRANGARAPFLLQRLNPAVFPDAARLMENIVGVTRHLAARRRAGAAACETLMLVPTTSGAAWIEDAAGACWRVYEFISGAHMQERPRGPADVREAARAFGEFLRLLADYDGPALHETIPGFHDTRARVARLEIAIQADTAARAASVRAEIAAVRAWTSLADVLPPYLASGEVPRRVVHNDAKLSNVLLDDATGRSRCVVDLDTVMPGTILHDFGDMVRSMTSPTDEEEADLTQVGVRLPLFEALAAGFLETAGAMLTARERSLLVHAGRLITYEQAVRFLTDHLEGDRYYRITRAGQNLARARAQLRLLETLAAHDAQLEAIVARAGD